MQTVQLFTENPLVFTGIALILGLMVGSFLNVVIYRLPIMMEREWRSQCRELLEQPGEPEKPETFNLVLPQSRCPHCGHRIGALENIPVISYLLQKGKCKHCAAPISARYPLIEAFTALLTAVVALQLGFTVQAAAAIALTWALIALSFIDIDHQLLPDSITYPLLWVGILVNLDGTFTDSQSSVIGAVAGYLSLWSVYQVHHAITGKEGMGFGDFKLLAALGAWMGWQYLVLIVLLSSLVGAIVGISLILIRGRDRNIPIPFGPYLAAAGWISLLWGKPIMQTYLGISGLSS